MQGNGTMRMEAVYNRDGSDDTIRMDYNINMEINRTIDGQ